MHWRERTWRWCVAAISAVAGLMPLPALAADRCILPETIPIPYPERQRSGEGPRVTPIAGYSLAMSWSPEHCAGSRRPDRDAFQCSGAGGRFGFVLHGLWPEGAGRDYPMWCRPAKLVPRPVLARHLCMSPSVQLLQRQWAKHGVCMSPHPDAYFRAAAILWNSVARPDRAIIARARSVGEVKRAFVALNPGLRSDMLSVQTARGGRLREVRLCLDRSMRRATCPVQRRGAGDGVRLGVTL